MSVSAVCSFCDVGFAREREVNDLHCTSSAREVARYTDSPRPLLLISRRFPARDDVPASLPENGKRERLAVAVRDSFHIALLRERVLS